MSENRIVTARFRSSRATTTTPIWQGDVGRTLVIEGVDDLPEVFEIDFANYAAGEAKTSIGQNGQVVIPSEFTQNGRPVIGYIVLHDTENDTITKYVISVPVNRRAERSNEEPSPDQQDAISEAIAALNEAVAKTAADVEAIDGVREAVEEIGESVTEYAERAEAAARKAESYTDLHFDFFIEEGHLFMEAT